MVVLAKNLNGGQPASIERSSPAAETVGEAFADGRRPMQVRSSAPQLLRSICFFISITGLVANHPHLVAQQVTSVAPLPGIAQDALPDAAETVRYPDAEPVAAKDEGLPVSIESDEPQTKTGSKWAANGNVVVTYENHTTCTPRCVLRADHIEGDDDTGDVTITGNVVVTGGQQDEHIQASHATLNIKTGTGRFYDVTGSVGMKAATDKPGTQRQVYANSNPFLFSGRLVVKTGPDEYEVYDGTVTSCQLPRPDWLLSAAKFSVDGEKARAKNSVFHLMNMPVLYLPYVTQPRDATSRQSGVLIPVVGDSSSKGLTFGEQIYWAINRSTDMTVGTIYYSDRGWEQSASFHYRGLGQNFAKAHYSGLLDRGYTPSGGTYTNQSGEDFTFSGRHDFLTDSTLEQTSSPESPDTQTRTAADVEYLSSFIYREAFSSDFNQAVSSDVLSTVYGTHEWNGMAASVEGDRYQGEKRVATTLLPEEQVHIFHAPALEFTTTDHRLGSTGLEWNVDSSVAALKRIQPNFATSGMIERMDVRPEVTYPFSFGGWRVRPSAAVRETFYSRSRLPPTPGVGVPVESTAALNRADFDLQFDVRPPVLERTFDSGIVKRLLHHDVKHTIEPELTYRYATGIGDFQQVLRFDSIDVASNTNELQYGATQRLFLRRTGNKPCHTDGGANANEVLGPTSGVAGDAGEPVNPEGKDGPAAPVCGNREWISWRLTQKYFFDPTFGGAVTNGRRNILDTTLSFSGIAFLTEPRNISPLLSRLRVRTSEKMDFEWDFDFDTGAKKFTADNFYLAVHQRDDSSPRPGMFAGIGYARLNAPGRSYVEGVASAVSDFNQMRVLAGYGKSTKAGFSVAANAGLDLSLGTVQYGAVQASYNWNCCGFSVEYRKYELGTARNENAYRFNFTLANIGTAGNLRRAQQVF
jgi:LPS-assembly protein